MGQPRETPCPVCGHGEARREYTHATGQSLLHCLRCGLLFFPEGEVLDYWSAGGSIHNVEIYSHPTVRREERRRWQLYLSWIEAEWEKSVQRKGIQREDEGRKLLDYGCGLGTFVEYARAQGWDAYGLDLSEAVVHKARARGLPVWTVAEHKAAMAPTTQQLFDVITLWDVLEHVPDPHQTLEFLSGLLRAGGLLFLETPDAEFYGRRWSLRLAQATQGRIDPARFFFYPDHRLYFPVAALKQLLEEHGLRVLWIRRSTTPSAKVFHKLRRVHRTPLIWAVLAWIALQITSIAGGNKLIVCAEKGPR